MSENKPQRAREKRASLAGEARAARENPRQPEPDVPVEAMSSAEPQPEVQNTAETEGSAGSPDTPIQDEPVSPADSMTDVERAIRAGEQTRHRFGAQDQTLAYEPRPGYHAHWFNDVGDRIAQAKAAGYDHVKDNEGKHVKKTVGVKDGGGGQVAYLMEIPEEWYQEDMAREQEVIDEFDKALLRGATGDGEPGHDGRYVPTDPDTKKSRIEVRTTARTR